MLAFLQHLGAGLATADIAFLVGAAFVAGLARGFSGFGAALIFIPLASSVIGPALAAPVLLVIDAVMALGMIPDAWRRADKRSVGIMSLGALLGVPVGTAILATVDALLVRWTIVVIVAALLLLLISGWRYRGEPRKLLTVGVGGISGLFSGAAQIGGPPVVAYWLGGAIESGIVRANIVLYFVVSSVLSIASYLAGGLFTQGVLALALATGPAYGIGLYLGSRLFGRTNEAVFRWTCYGLIAVAAILSLPALDSMLR
jgi:uncharacterized membrane protein YfcA